MKNIKYSLSDINDNESHRVLLHITMRTCMWNDSFFQWL